MERVTKRMPDGRLMLKAGGMEQDFNACLEGMGHMQADALMLAMQKLAEYEDLGQKGLLVKKPCFIGDTVRLKRKDADLAAKAIDFGYHPHCGFYALIDTPEYGALKIPFSVFGVAAFVEEKEE